MSGLAKPRLICCPTPTHRRSACPIQGGGSRGQNAGRPACRGSKFNVGHDPITADAGSEASHRILRFQDARNSAARAADVARLPRSSCYSFEGPRRHNTFAGARSTATGRKATRFIAIRTGPPDLSLAHAVYGELKQTTTCENVSVIAKNAACGAQLRSFHRRTAECVPPLAGHGNASSSSPPRGTFNRISKVRTRQCPGHGNSSRISRFGTSVRDKFIAISVT